MKSAFSFAIGYLCLGGVCLSPTVFAASAQVNAIAPTKSERFKITAAKGSYVLYWDVVYQFNVSNSWSTVIEPPVGYTVTDIIMGDTKLFKTERSENRAVIKRIAPDNVSTNMVLVLEGVDRIPHTLAFDLTGNNDSRVSSIQFMMPQDRESNSLVEATKAIYKKQLTEALSSKEIEMQARVQSKTVQGLTTFRFGSYENSTSEKKYGVKVYLNSVVNSDNKGYVFFTTNAYDPQCQVVEMVGITGENVSKPVEQIATIDEQENTRYVIETSPFLKDGKKHKYKFILKIYQDTVYIKAKIQ
jgi:hypothetical protein